MKNSYLLNDIFIYQYQKKNQRTFNQIMFKVPYYMTKYEIKYILESFYNFKVKNINTILVREKKKRSKHSFYTISKFKKAFITLN